MRTFTIITTVANPLMAELHDSMPVILGSRDRPTRLGEWPRVVGAEK
jgi:putative SOS response-associated peptidase YedK